MDGSDIVFLTLYAIFITFGVTGNSMVIHVVRKTRSMHTATNFLLVNLAIADALTLLFSPFIWNAILETVHPAGITGDIVCVLLTGNCFMEVTIDVSILTLCLLAMERYHALVKPMSVQKRLTRENVKYVIPGVWIFSILYCIPSYLAYRHDVKENGNCLNVWGYNWAKDNKIYVYCTLGFIIVPAFVSMFYCYLKIIQGMYFTNEVLATNKDIVSRDDAHSKKRLTIMFITVTLIFFVSYFPIIGMSIYGLVSDVESWKKQVNILAILQEISWLLVFAGCSLNPLLYHLQSKNYRQGFRKMLRCQYNFNERNVRHEGIEMRSN